MPQRAAKRLFAVLTVRRGWRRCLSFSIGPFHKERLEKSPAYGLKKRNKAFSSSALNPARTLICLTIVPEMRGEKPWGALWQREQFCSKTSCPSFCVALWTALPFACCCELAGKALPSLACENACAVESKRTKREIDAKTFILIYLSTPERESDKRSRSPRY